MKSEVLLWIGAGRLPGGDPEMGQSTASTKLNMNELQYTRRITVL